MRVLIFLFSLVAIANGFSRQEYIGQDSLLSPRIRRLIRNLKPNVYGPYSRDQVQECNPGEVRNYDGSCVNPVINMNVFAFIAPKVKHHQNPVSSINIPDPQIDLNVVFVKSPVAQHVSKSFVLPPPQQKTKIYLLHQEPDVNQKLIELPDNQQQDPEVFFISYGKGDNPKLPGGIDLETALSHAMEPVESGFRYSQPQESINLKNELRYAEPQKVIDSDTAFKYSEPQKSTDSHPEFSHSEPKQNIDFNTGSSFSGRHESAYSDTRLRSSEPPKRTDSIPKFRYSDPQESTDSYSEFRFSQPQNGIYFDTGINTEYLPQEQPAPKVTSNIYKGKLNEFIRQNLLTNIRIGDHPITTKEEYDSSRVNPLRTPFSFQELAPPPVEEISNVIQKEEPSTDIVMAKDEIRDSHLLATVTQRPTPTENVKEAVRTDNLNFNEKKQETNVIENALQRQISSYLPPHFSNPNSEDILVPIRLPGVQLNLYERSN